MKLGAATRLTVEKGFANTLVSILISVDRKHPALPRQREEPEVSGVQSRGSGSQHRLLARG